MIIATLILATIPQPNFENPFHTLPEARVTCEINDQHQYEFAIKQYILTLTEVRKRSFLHWKKSHRIMIRKLRAGHDPATTIKEFWRTIMPTYNNAKL